METVAVYWESRIKTYGFQRITDLSLFEFFSPFSEIKQIGEFFSQSKFQDLNSKFIVAQESDEGLTFAVCLPLKKEEAFYKSLKENRGLTFVRHIFPAGIIYFHGPHFGDRYGVADATLSTLSRAGINILATDCSSASVFLVLAHEDLDRAEEELSRTFETV